MNQNDKTNERLESQPFFDWVDDEWLKCQLSIRLIKAIEIRKSNFTQKEVSNYISCSLTKVKEIEKGTTKDFNAINNYLNLLGC